MCTSHNKGLELSISSTHCKHDLFRACGLFAKGSTQHDLTSANHTSTRQAVLASVWQHAGSGGTGCVHLPVTLRANRTHQDA